MRSDPISAGLHAGRETTASQRAYLLFLLLSANILNYADRGLPSILLPSIRRDLVLSDTQLALIIGFAFSLFYSIVGIPLGRLSDRFRRSTLLSICIALWSVMTAVTGLAGSFFHLAIGRFGVGIGEAGLAPSSHSLISDFYPPRGRTTALAIVALGIPLGSLTAYLVGGGLNHLFGWRMAFFVMAIPGLILALLIGFTLRELPRGRADGLVDTGKVPSFVSVVKILWHIPSYRHCLLGTAFSGMTYGAVVHWAPSFLSRSYGMQTLDIGSWLAPLVGIGGGAGTLLGGYLVDRLLRAGHQVGRLVAGRRTRPGGRSGLSGVSGAAARSEHRAVVSADDLDSVAPGAVCGSGSGRLLAAYAWNGFRDLASDFGADRLRASGLC